MVVQENGPSKGSYSPDFQMKDPDNADGWQREGSSIAGDRYTARPKEGGHGKDWIGGSECASQPRNRIYDHSHNRRGHTYEISPQGALALDLRPLTWGRMSDQPRAINEARYEIGEISGI
jgi:hypothetical protein